jgi:hypothetical protein
MRALRLLLAAASLAGSGGAAAQPVTFVYDDFDRFVAALKQVDAGAPAEATFQAYIDGAGPPYGFYKDRYGATGKSIAAAVAKRPNHYRRVAGLRPYLQSQEAVVQAGIDKLRSMVPGMATPPVYFMIGNLSAGGINAGLKPEIGGHPSAPAVLVETLAMGPDTDMSEWAGPYGGGYLEDIAYTAVHEMVHAYQLRIQGRPNYISIYQQGNAGNTYLGLALREGCADHLTRLAVGRIRAGKQESWGLANERQLWTMFRPLMEQPGSFADGWFGALDPKTPDWPPQIGYWLGSRICAAYHESAADKAAAVRDIMAAYLIDDFRKIAAPYENRMSKSAN